MRTTNLAPAQGVRGTRNVLGALAAHRRALVERFAALCEVRGFEEVEVPILARRTALSHLGETSDVVASQLFHVASSDGDVVLRPEGTAPVMAALAARAADQGGYGRRLWYAGPMFRHERPQRLRLRQFTQLGAEVVGDASLGADVEAVALAADFLRHAALAGEGGRVPVRLVVNSLGTANDRRRYNESLAAYLQGPRYAALSAASRARVDAGRCLRVLDSKLAEDVDVMRAAPRIEEYVSDGESARLRALCDRLAHEEALRSFDVAVDPALVRGLDYYTSTAFEFLRDGRAVAAGGRYAQLHGQSGVGFAVGLERVERQDVADDAGWHWQGMCGGVVVLPIGGAQGCEAAGCALGEAVSRVTAQLRRGGVRAMARREGGKVGRQISRAVRCGARAVVIIGPQDLADGMCKVKVLKGKEEYEDLYEQSRVQHDVALDEVSDFCRRMLTEPHAAPSAPAEVPPGAESEQRSGQSRIGRLA